ncbi:hypothetical protein BDU57DRAFT_509337 [Ampelomyces quisqualis]|uniref:Uncharacterized protein n=1 Tax=Ampelomyces quisqualis TaxID=50730 RepID=A0A6A5R162_AMPQU|nr:hypothetical protein BDU57DRAFT_509337 [Ampelomyces quisqualis]
MRDPSVQATPLPRAAKPCASLPYLIAFFRQTTTLTTSTPYVRTIFFVGCGTCGPVASAQNTPRNNYFPHEKA